MATYAAFKHVELHKVGYGKNRVPNAPRGCIGEIFGGEASNNGNGKKSTDVCDTPSRPRDTHSRLFGTPNRPATAVRDTLKSNIKFGEEQSKAPQMNGNGHTNGHSNGHANGHSPSPTKAYSYIRRNPVTGVGIGDPRSFLWSPRTRLRREGNPITGEGYKSMNGEINTSVTSLNGNASPINHNRVPPGGYSSGLW